MNQRFFLIVFAMLAGVSLTGKSHPLHLSISELFYNSVEQSLEVSVRLFTDDLELNLETQGVPPLKIGSPWEHKETDRYLEKYLQQHFSIKLNGSPVSLNFLGKEVENDVTWVYLEALELPAPQRVQVLNTLLNAELPQQRNIVHVRLGKTTKSLLLQAGKWQDEVVFE